MSFEANHGQTDPQVHFLARGPGYSLFLTSTEAVLRLQKPAPRKAGPPALGSRKPLRGYAKGTKVPAPRETTLLRMQLIGANASPTVTGLDALPGTVHSFRGQDPTQWRSGAPTYHRVKYTGVYPGVDLLYYGQQRQLEYDFVVAPQADPQRITLGFSGAERLEVTEQGALVVHIGDEVVRLHRPVVYQEVAGQRQEIAGHYVLRSANRVGFALAAYDASRPLTIDPVVEYATYLGGSGFDYISAIAVDRHGHVYVTGLTQSTDFPTRHAPQPVIGAVDSGDVFIAKLSANGRRLLGPAHMKVDTCGKPYLHTLHIAFKAHRISAEVPRSSKGSCFGNMAIRLL